MQISRKKTENVELGRVSLKKISNYSQIFFWKYLIQKAYMLSIFHFLSNCLQSISRSLIFEAYVFVLKLLNFIFFDSLFLIFSSFVSAREKQNEDTSFQSRFQDYECDELLKFLVLSYFTSLAISLLCTGGSKFVKGMNVSCLLQRMTFKFVFCCILLKK